MGVGQRVQDTLIGVDAAEEQRLYIKILEDAVQRCVPKAADPAPVDLDIFWKLLEFIDDGGRPAVLLKQMRPVAWQLTSDTDAVTVATEHIKSGRRQVLAIQSVAPVEPDDWNSCAAQR